MTLPRDDVENPAQPRPDRRTRQREARREQVFEAAVFLFTQRGFDSTTMDDIASRADVARATVFNHFSRKVEFIHEWTARRRHHAAAVIRSEQLGDHSLAQIFGRYMRELAKLSEQTREETVALMSAAVHSTNVLSHPALGQELSRYVVAAQRRGETSDAIDADVAGLLLASGYFAILTEWISEDPAPFRLADRLSALVDVLLAGIASTGPANRDRPAIDGRPDTGSHSTS